MNEELMAKLRRALLAPLAALLVLTLRGSVARGSLVGAAELVYLGQLALALGALATLVLSLLALLALRFPARGGALVLGLFALGTLPYVWQVASYLTTVDGVTRRKLSPVAVELTVIAVMLSIVCGLWWLTKELRGSWLRYLVLLGLLSLVGGIDAAFGKAVSRLAPGLYLAASMAVCWLLPAVAPALIASFRRALVPLLAVFALALLALFAPGLRERGRSALHLPLSSLPHLDMRLLVQPVTPSLLPHLGSDRLPSCAAPAPLALPPALAALPRKNLVFVSIDTVRMDAAERMVAGKPLMPELQRFMAESWSGVAHSAYPATMMSFTAVFSGLLPTRLMLSAEPPSSVFGALRERGVERVAVVPKGNYFQRKPIESYIIQGARRYLGRNAKHSTDQAISKLTELRKKQQQHALWIHYMEPHEPYEKQPGFDFGDAPHERYWSELAHVDVQLGRLLAALRKLRVYDDTLVFVFSDHGEAFGEHGQTFHHYTLYPWLTRVPFALHVPGAQPRRLSTPVHLADVAATSMHFIGHTPSVTLDGRSLLQESPPEQRSYISEEFPAQLSALEGFAKSPLASTAELRERASRIERSEGYPSKISLTRGQQLLVLHRGTGVRELYDLANDPAAEHNRGLEDTAELRGLTSELERWLAAAAASAGCKVTKPAAAR